MKRFSGKKVLVIGAGAGMGEATTLQFLDEGANVIAVEMFQDRLERLTELAGDKAENLITFLGDINENETVNAVKNLVEEKFETLDILAYVAGVMDCMATPETLTEEIWDRVMNTNVKGAWKTVSAVVPFMKNHEDPASIVIVTSLGGRVGSSSGTAYIASKWAAEGLVKNLAFTYRFDNIRVNSVAPGAITTEIGNTSTRLYGSALDPVGSALYQKKGIATVNLVRGKPHNIADAILFLCSDQASFVSGASLLVDGGWGSV